MKPLTDTLDQIAAGAETDPQRIKAASECAAYEVRRLRKALTDIHNHCHINRRVPQLQYVDLRSTSALAVERVP